MARYRKIFLFHPLPFKNDGSRTDFDRSHQNALYVSLSQTYKEYGHEIVYVPCASVDERAALVVKEIEASIGTSMPATRPLRVVAGGTRQIWRNVI